ncbi:MAG TPA: sialidase family protein, partial [Steroidobacteraceae bacterium]|nr:sialidase family protein [Steroidobacteraceae bacterium]
EGEPAIRADPAGNFYGSSENVFCVIGGLCGGTFAWKSTDAGAHFTTLPLLNSVTAGQVGLSPAGGDTDIAVAPRKNANGFYNIYVVSLASKPPLFDIYVSTSRDGGATWSINPLGASIPLDDREWIVADGAQKVCISYHAEPTTDDIVVNCSYDAGLTFTQLGSAFDTTDLFNAALENQIGNLAIDPGNHVIYQVWSSIANAGELTCTGCSTHAVWIGVSIDGGKNFTDHIVYNNLDTTVAYGHQFVNVAVDRAGNVYVVFSDNHNLFYSFSTDFGQSWSAPKQINKPPSNTAIFPWASAGRAGALDVVWYGTSFYDGMTIPDNYPMSAAWNVYFGQNLQATTPGSSFTTVQASGVIHYGGVCESGVTCTGNRDLLDDFGVAASPTTGLAAIIYTSDQYLGTAAEPARAQGSKTCTPDTSNSVQCSHTDIAVQTGGSGVGRRRDRHFEVEEEDLEETNVADPRKPSPQLKMRIANTADVAITAFAIQVGGLPVAFAWDSTSPLLPGETVSGTASSLPSGLALAVGNVYPITITATLPDGTTENQTTSAIYTLGAGLGL